jgi:hypothetical protein
MYTHARDLQGNITLLATHILEKEVHVYEALHPSHVHQRTRSVG